MTHRKLSLRRDARGAALMEFGLVAPTFFLMLMFFFDVAHSMYASSVLQGVMQTVARQATLETGTTAGARIDTYVETQMRTIVGSGATFVPVRRSYSDFSSVGDPERFNDTNGNGQWNAGECFEDVNGNGQWDADLGRTGQGGAHDAVLYRVTITYPRMFPMAQVVGLPATQELKASTVLRNQPYGNQTRPVFAVCP